jgi:hypothetical protein
MLFNKNCSTEEEENQAILKFLDIGLLEKKICQRCNRDCAIKDRRRKADSKNRIIAWRCGKCCSFYSMYDGSFFGNFKKPLYDLLAIIKCWAAELSVAKALSILGFGDTLVKYCPEFMNIFSCHRDT